VWEPQDALRGPLRKEKADLKGTTEEKKQQTREGKLEVEVGGPK